MKARIGLLIGALLLGCVGTHAQHSKSRSNSRRISKQSPTVHISFVKFGKREPRYNSESNEGVWLRVYNNTPWSLTFLGMDWFTNEEREMRVFYGVNAIPTSRDLFQDSSPPYPLPPPPGSPLEAISQSKMASTQKESYEDCKAPPDDWEIHVVSPITLPSGKSMIFSVPRETLCKNLKIYLKYNYSWERRGRYRPFDDEPDHRVYFAGSDLPK